MDFCWAIPKGFCGKIFPRPSLIRDKSVTVEAGITDPDYRGLVYVLLSNHSGKVFTVRMDERIAQAVFFETFDVHFEKVSSKEDLGVIKRESGGFGLTGTTVIKKMKVNETFQDDSLAIIAEEGVISVNDEVILHEKVDNEN